MSNILIEICVDSLSSAEIAVANGAGRLEVCGFLGIGGGTTPSLGLIRSIRRKFPNVPLMAMIRPRPGDFIYKDTEMEVMKEDISAFRNEGVKGVVFGVLNELSEIDVLKTTQLVEAAHGLEVTFHRAFDMTPDPMRSLSSLLGIAGISRILTSGLQPKATQALSLLRELSQILESSAHHSRSLTLLPGSGINASNVKSVVEGIGSDLTEVHLSGSLWVEGSCEIRKEGMGMGVGSEGEWDYWVVNAQKVRDVRTALDEIVL